MVVSPAVLSKEKKAKKSANVSFSEAVSSTSSPVASTSKVPIAATSTGDDAQMEDEDDGVEGDGEWQSRQSAAHPSGSTSTGKEKSSEEGQDEDQEEDDDAVMIDSNTLLPPVGASHAQVAEADQGLLKFPALSAKDMQGKVETQTRKVSIPPHRMTPLKRDWLKIYSPLVDECGLMVRMNVNKKNIEMKTTKHTQSPSNTILQRAVDFVAAYGLGFSAEDAIALLRIEDLFVETFEIRDVKTLSGDHLSRAIGRIAGKDGKTRFTIENVSRTRIVLADQKIHILGTFSSIKVARDAICALILGSPPGKVYNNLRTVAARQRQRF